MEVGFPVETVLPADGEIYASKIPGGKCVMATVKGSYSRIPEAWSKFFGDVIAGGLNIAGSPRDHYLNDPSTTPEDDLITNIMIPISEAEMRIYQSCDSQLFVPQKRKNFLGSNGITKIIIISNPILYCQRGDICFLSTIFNKRTSRITADAPREVIIKFEKKSAMRSPLL
ncbi:hypothetical protein FACS1894120_6740 [Clostridia bacterium]|nr:hypothetical protein FACS1894120_6740 [Clostridia bacterium]